ncbi:hypothetical protein [Legionella sp. CNM-4043-24]|uniref:hypothetical protein n=1 Tax=Legionella sp. CNM-4043-24 TaxID=3421646 RepID=UPI00403B06FA
MSMNHVELLVVNEFDSHGVSICLKPHLPDVITPSLVNEIRHVQNTLAENYFKSPWEGLLYVVWYSHRRMGHCKRGLDFNFIMHSLLHHKENELETYVKNLFDLLFLNSVGLGLPLINCSLVSGLISGVFQEFFYLNKINFIKKRPRENRRPGLTQVSISDISRKRLFPEQVYENNIYYLCNSFDLTSMCHILERTEADLPDERQIKAMQRQFDAMYQATLLAVYQMAANKMNLLKRVASIQNRQSTVA